MRHNIMGSWSSNKSYTCHLVVLLLLMNAIATSPARILLYPFGHCINSHLFNMERMAAILLSGGHDVTMIVTTTYKGPYIRESLSGIQYLKYEPPEGVQPICQFDSLDEYLETPLSKIYSTFQQTSLKFCEAVLQDSILLHKIKTGHFELAIYDAVDQCSKILADYVDIPFIAFHTHGLDSVMPRNPAYMPSMLTSFSDDMSLWQRTLNTLGYAVQQAIIWNIYHNYEALKLKYNINTTVHIRDTFDRASLRFVLGDYGLDYVGPVQPNTILLGGNIHTDSSMIPKQLQELLTESEDRGVVVFSFGSLVRHYGPKWREFFAKSLARVPYTVIWKYNGEAPQNLGNNTHLMPWIPQQALLNHPSVSAFVTHCGMNSAFEAAYNGVPVVGIPLFADQFYQASKLTERGHMGIKLNIQSLTENTLHDTIIDVVEKNIYRENAQHISHIMHNRPRPQNEDILYWVSYVIKLKGASHLRSNAAKLAWYQYLLLDVTLVLTVATILIIATMWLTLHLIFYCLKGLLVKKTKKVKDISQFSGS